MQCAKSYQDIKTPDEIEEEYEEEAYLERMAEEYDPEEAGGCSFAQYMANCRRIYRNRQ